MLSAKKEKFCVGEGGQGKMTKAGNRIKGVHLQPDSPTTLHFCSGGRGAYVRVAVGGALQGRRH